MSTKKLLLAGAVMLSLVVVASGAEAANGRGILRIRRRPVNGSGQSVSLNGHIPPAEFEANHYRQNDSGHRAETQTTQPA
jgi:hypothetical protein